MSTLFRTMITMAVIMGMAGNIQGEIRVFTNEAAFKNALTQSISENFDGPDWDGVRTIGTNIVATPSVTSQGITWTSGDRVSTSEGPSRNGWAIFSFEHTTPDKLIGTSTNPLFGVGGWFKVNTPPAKIHLTLDNTTQVDFNDPIIDTQHTFLGVISTAGFTTFEFSEVEGTLGDMKFFFADDFTFATVVDLTPGNLSPMADAGIDQTVLEGSNVALDGAGSSNQDDGIMILQWRQISGPAVALSDPTQLSPTFVTPPVDLSGSDLIFELTVTDSQGLRATDQVQIVVMDNGIDLFPADALTFFSSTGQEIALRVESGGQLVDLWPSDPGDISDDAGQPADMPYGLLNFHIKTDHPGGTSTVSVFLPQPAPADYTWYKYSSNIGWIDFSPYISFNSDRTQVLLTLVDGGSGDEDGNSSNGIIIDPSGLGMTDSGPATGDSPGGGGGGGGGCFISAANLKLAIFFEGRLGKQLKP